MNRRLFWILGVLSALLGTLSAVAQSDAEALVLRNSLPVRARFATADNLGNLYLITPQNAVEKYAIDGRLLARYTNNRSGMAKSIDAANPMKVLVWYADFRTVVFLDRNLTPLGTLNLIEAGYPEVRTVGAAADGHLWIYDEVTFQLKKISPEGALLAESPQLNALLAERLPIDRLCDDGSQVYAFSAQHGLLLFDSYGQFRHRIPVADASTCVAATDRIRCLTPGCLLLLDPVRLTEHRLPLPSAAIEQQAEVWLAEKQLLLQRPGSMDIWEWPD